MVLFTGSWGTPTGPYDADECNELLHEQRNDFIYYGFQLLRIRLLSVSRQLSGGAVPGNYKREQRLDHEQRKTDES